MGVACGYRFIWNDRRSGVQVELCSSAVVVERRPCEPLLVAAMACEHKASWLDTANTPLDSAASSWNRCLPGAVVGVRSRRLAALSCRALVARRFRQALIDGVQQQYCGAIETRVKGETTRRAAAAND
jgi:hypothetical protein